jgi:hypothetical protein
MLTLSVPLPQSFASFAPEVGSLDTAGSKEALQHMALYSSAHVDVAYNHHYLYCNWKSLPAGESLRA